MWKKQREMRFPTEKLDDDDYEDEPRPLDVELLQKARVGVHAVDASDMHADTETPAKRRRTRRRELVFG